MFIMGGRWQRHARRRSRRGQARWAAAGNDTYIVDNAGDVIIEAASGGTDTVKTALAAYTLGAEVENLIYTGTAAFAGTGNAANNAITGGKGNDTLNGGTRNRHADRRRR